MGNSESMPRALHDNFLAVSASIKSRLGPAAAAASQQESAAGRGGAGPRFSDSFGPTSGDESDDYILRKGASRRKHSKAHSRASNSRRAGGGSSLSSSSPSPAAGRRVPAARSGVPRRMGEPEQHDGPVTLVTREESTLGAAYSRGKGGVGEGAAADDAYNSYDSTGSNTPAAAPRAPRTVKAVPDGVQQRTNGGSSYSRQSSSGSSQKQEPEGCVRGSTDPQKSGRRSASDSNTDSEERCAGSAKAKSPVSSSSERGDPPTGETPSKEDMRQRPSLPLKAAAGSLQTGGTNKNEGDAVLDWDAALDFAEEGGGDGVMGDEETRRLGTRASSVKAASPRLFPSSPTAESWPGVRTSAAAVSPSASSAASSRARSPQQPQRAAAAGSTTQEGLRHGTREKARTQRQETVTHFGSSRSATRSSSSSKTLDERRLSERGPPESSSKGPRPASVDGGGGGDTKGRGDRGILVAAEAADSCRHSSQKAGESAAERSTSTRNTTHTGQNSAGSTDNKEGTTAAAAAAAAERWPAAVTLDQCPPAMAGRAHHSTGAGAASAREGTSATRRKEGYLAENSGCFSFNSSSEREKAGRMVPMLLQQEEETGVLSLLSPSNHLDVTCTRPATPTTDATTVGSSSSSAEESWGAGGSSRLEGGRGSKAPGGRLSPPCKRGDAEAAAGAETAVAGAAGANAPAAAAIRSVGASEAGRSDAAAGVARGGRRTLPGRERSRSKKIIYGNPRNHFPFLEEPALSHMLPFLFDRSLAACMTVCPHWFMRINGCIERMCAPINKRFAAAYGDYLQLWGAAVKLQPLQTADRDGVRIDWIIFAKVLPAAAGKFIQFGYTYSYSPVPSRRLNTLELVRKINSSGPHGSAGGARGKSSQNRSSSGRGAADYPHREGLILSPDGQPCPSMSPRRVYAVSYCLAAGSAGSSRALWFHRDNCRFHGDETGVVAMSSVSPVCVGDFVEVAVSLASGEGRVALETVDWLPLQQETRRESNPARGVFTRETCPVENTFCEWFDADTFRQMSTEKVRESENFGPRLKLERTVYSGFDVAVRKSTYRAVAPGSVGAQACRQWGFPCEILPAGVPVVCPLIRRGLQHDRFLSVQMRVGDVVTYYVSQGGNNT